MGEKCMEPCGDLKRLEREVKELQSKIGTDHKELRGRLAEIEKQDAVQFEQYRTILEKLDGLTKMQNQFNKKLQEIEAKPAKRWKDRIEKVVVAVILAVTAFFLGKVGL